ncbi:MAG: type II toxin-antitoxin system PemK/MazF family toxin [Gemmataceae bacterium]|nr:type II toxin-antitoxin system PemK/MazF family toxin [Gemmataceae bacterium]
MVINQGDLFWLDLGEPAGSEPGSLHPFVVIQNDAFNKSQIKTTVVCALTSNRKLALAPGNVALHKGEGNLTKPSVVNISQVMTVDKGELREKIGQLSKKRMQEIVAGFEVLIQPRIL